MSQILDFSKDKDANSNPCFYRDRIVLMFEFGPYPSIPKGTRAAVKIGNGKLSADKSEWEAVIYKESGKTLVLEVAELRDLYRVSHLN